MQASFLHAVGVSVSDAFLNFNLAPLNLRRDIAMLGLLQKCATGSAHPDLCKLFPMSSSVPHRHGTRLQNQRHDKQLEERCDGRHSDQMARSLFGLVRVYNRLPQHIVDSKDVSTFQTALTEAARKQCRDNSRNWCNIFSPTNY